jgi:cbb3-type cytochrome oxidase cytochrome c subunit
MTKNLSLILSVCFILLIAILPGCINYNGEKLFHKEGCIICHSYNGKGGMMGPDLTAISNIRSDEWINSYIQSPGNTYPLARMPAFPHLSSRKRKAIIGFLNE